MQDLRFQLRPAVRAVISTLAAGLALSRLIKSAYGLAEGKPDDFLAFPMTVVLPGAALAYLIRMPATRTSEGLMMRFAAMVLILMIIALPAAGLHLALGFPVAFLIVEMFETRVPAPMRSTVKRWIAVR
ncbi:hypothetical protein [Rhizobium sp. BR 314]|uniref:hypothetical protein n=1 Tax=Rhizobium sp. BR 314 TaxID=3040013 RepID=UPI0039BF2DDE